MKVDHQAGVYFVQDISDNERAVRVSVSGSKTQKSGTASFFMGGFLNETFDPIEQRRELAKKKAYKVVQDAFARERKIDSDLQERSDHAKKLRGEKAQAQREIQAIDNQIEELRKSYGVEKDSTELPEEYQKRVKELNSYKQPYERAIMICERGMYDQAGIYEDYAVIRGTGLERLKRSPMLKAEGEAEEILAAASEEIIGMLVDEAKDHIDDKQQEEQEKAEERKEEKKEEAEKLEESKERREELEALLYPEREKKEHTKSQASDIMSGDPLTENLLKMEGVQTEVKQEIEEVVQKLNLVAEDLKGIRVDESV